MTWSVTSTVDPSRWLTSDSGLAFDADPITAAALGDLSTVRVPLWPGGPSKLGVATPAELVLAAWRAIPAPDLAGDPPPADKAFATSTVGSDIPILY